MPSNQPPPGRYLSIGGGNLSGPLIAARPPALNMEVATKQYSDATPNQPITFSGDVAGSGASAIAATVTGLQGRPISSAAPAAGSALAWSGAAWAPFAAPAPARAQNYTNPAGTSSTALVQMGCGLSIIPVATGRLLILASGAIRNTVAGDGGVLQLSYGTGTAPANGAAATGTSPGNFLSLAFAATTDVIGWALQAWAPSPPTAALVLGTAYWVDIQLKVNIGGTTTISNVTLTAVEV